MIKELLQQGFILKSQGRYKYAIEAFYKALELDNTSAELMLEIADCYYKMKDNERALVYIEQALNKNPTHLDSLRLLQQIFVDKNALAEAEQTAKNVYCISKDINDLAEIFHLLNLQENYSEIFEYQSEETNAKILFEKAYAKMYLNDLESAEYYINAALEQDGSNKNLLLKGKILLKMNREEECIKIINAMDINTTDADMLNFVGLVKQHEGNFKQALHYFTEAIKLMPTNDEYYYNCASTYFKMDNIQQAKKYYNLAINIAPENQNYHFALANLYYSEKHYKRAMEELDYDFFEAKLLKAIILYDSGYIALAKKELEILEVEEPNNELIQIYKSKIAEELTI